MHSSVNSVVSSAVTATDPEIVIPSYWRPEVEECLRNKALTTNARNEIVRTVVNQLISRNSKPTRIDCEQLARKLILKYPFMKDKMGCGYVS